MSQVLWSTRLGGEREDGEVEGAIVAKGCCLSAGDEFMLSCDYEVGSAGKMSQLIMLAGGEKMEE